MEIRRSPVSLERTNVTDNATPAALRPDFESSLLDIRDLVFATLTPMKVGSLPQPCISRQVDSSERPVVSKERGCFARHYLAKQQVKREPVSPELASTTSELSFLVLDGSSKRSTIHGAGTRRGHTRVPIEVNVVQQP